MAGSIKVAGHTIAQHDITSDKVDIQNATLGSSVTFPAGHPYSIKVYTQTTGSDNTTTQGIGFGPVRSVSLDAGENVLITISGGTLYYNGNAQCWAGIQYDTSNLTTET